MKGDTKCRKRGGFGKSGVTQGHCNQPFITYCSINAGLDTTQLVKLVKIAMTN